MDPVPVCADPLRPQQNSESSTLIAQVCWKPVLTDFHGPCGGGGGGRSARAAPAMPTKAPIVSSRTSTKRAVASTLMESTMARPAFHVESPGELSSVQQLLAHL